MKETAWGQGRQHEGDKVHTFRKVRSRHGKVDDNCLQTH